MRRRDVACDSHRDEGEGVEEIRTRRGFPSRRGLSHEHVMVCSDGLTPRHAASPASEKSCGYQGQVLAIATPKRFPGDCRNPWRTILPAIVTPPCLETVDGLKTPSKPVRVQNPRISFLDHWVYLYM